MLALLSFRTLYNQPVFNRETPGNDFSVVRWWESRRGHFNLIVGCAGVITCILCIICASVSEPIVGEAIGLPDPLILGVLGILLYGILANFFYTFGWVFELVSRLIATPKKSALFGTRAFKTGITFSVALTLLPSLFCWLAFGYALLTGQKHGSPPE